MRDNTSAGLLRSQITGDNSPQLHGMPDGKQENRHQHGFNEQQAIKAINEPHHGNSRGIRATRNNDTRKITSSAATTQSAYFMALANLYSTPQIPPPVKRLELLCKTLQSI
jgi:hypothetical protein